MTESPPSPPMSPSSAPTTFPLVKATKEIMTRHVSLLSTSIRWSPRSPSALKRRLLRDSSTLVFVLLVVGLLAIISPTAEAVTYDVTPEGSPYSLTDALAVAGPGDTISLADGKYDEAIVTMQGGEPGSPLTIVGDKGAVVAANSNDRVVLIQHSWVTLQGFSVDGQAGDSDEESSFVSKCIYVQGDDEELVGFKMQNMDIGNCGGECVRLRDSVTESEISDNVIENCGVHAYRFGSGGKNGEAIYIGTSSKQWSGDADSCSRNLVTGNTLIPNGNECVDIKEGSTGNIVEKNTCEGQFDSSSGCYGSRGDANIFRYNSGTKCEGVGVRLGGWEVDGYQYGQHNQVYGNTFEEMETGVLNIKVAPQGTICGNTCSDGSCATLGEGSSDASSTWDQPCSESDIEGEESESADDEESDDTPDATPVLTTTPSPESTPAPSPMPSPMETATPIPITEVPTPSPQKAGTIVPTSGLTIAPSSDVVETPIPTPSPVTADTPTPAPDVSTQSPVPPSTPAPVDFTPTSSQTLSLTPAPSPERVQTPNPIGVESTPVPSEGDSPAPTSAMISAPSSDVPETPAPIDAIPTPSPVDTDRIDPSRTTTMPSLSPPTTSPAPGQASSTPSPAQLAAPVSEATTTDFDSDEDSSLSNVPTTSPVDGYVACDAVELLESYVTATATTQDGNSAHQLVDGDVTDRWSALGMGSWFTVELPEAVSLAGMRLWFEDGETRQQRLTAIYIGEDEVAFQEEISSGTTAEGQYFAFHGTSLIKSLIIVGYGNTVNNWNSVNEIQLCKAQQAPSRNLRGSTDGTAAVIEAAPRRRQSLRGGRHV